MSITFHRHCAQICVSAYRHSLLPLARSHWQVKRDGASYSSTHNASSSKEKAKVGRMKSRGAIRNQISRQKSLKAGAGPKPYGLLPSDLSSEHFQHLLAVEDLEAVLQLYPKLSDKQQLLPDDTFKIAQLLHFSLRANGKSQPSKDIEQEAIKFINFMKRRQVPPHPHATLHLISCLKESKNFDAGIDLWNWAVVQDDRHINLKVYGAAIELLADYGQPLAYCEKVYMHALQRFPGSFAEYHLSPTAIVSSRGHLTNIHGTSMILLQGITYARLVNGDWRNAYLALDTALRLHPAQLPTRLISLFIFERPITEAYLILCMVCRSGNKINPADITLVVNDLVTAQLMRNSEKLNQDLAEASVSVIHFALGSNQTLNSIHVNTLLGAILRLLPGDVLADGRQYSREDLTVSAVFQLFGSLGFSPTLSTFNNMISLAGRLRNQPLLHTAIKRLITSGLEPNEITRKCFRNFCRAYASSLEQQLKSSYQSCGSEIPPRLHDICGNLVTNALAEDPPNRSSEISRTIPSETDRVSSHPSAIQPEEAYNSTAAVIAMLQRMLELTINGEIGNLCKHPVRLSPAVDVESGIQEEWERKLYEELTVDPAWSTEPSNENTKQIETSTGFPLETIRYENWRDVNNLMIYAERFERDLKVSIDRAIERKQATRRSRTSRELPDKARRRELITTVSNHKHEAQNSFITEEDWRAKILDLRRTKP